MFSAAAPAGPDRRPSAPIASRCSLPSGRKNAHRGVATCRRAESGKPCSQALIASGKNRCLATTTRRSHLLQQSGYPMVESPISITITPSPSAIATFVFNHFAEPMFGWVDCAGNQCSSWETVYRFVRGPLDVAEGIVGGKLLGAVAGAIGSKLASAIAKDSPQISVFWSGGAAARDAAAAWAEAMEG